MQHLIVEFMSMVYDAKLIKNSLIQDKKDIIAYNQ